MADDGSAQAANVHIKLRLESILMREFDYAVRAAERAIEARDRQFALFLTFLAASLPGIAAVYQLSANNFIFGRSITLVLLSAASLLCFVFFGQALALRGAFRESLIAANIIKEYYISHLHGAVPDVDNAFRWRLKTIPSGEGRGTNTFSIATTIAFVGSCTVGGVAFLVDSYFLEGNIVPAYGGSLQPYIVGGACLILCGLWYMIRYQAKLSRRIESKLLAKLTDSIENQHSAIAPE